MHGVYVIHNSTILTLNSVSELVKLTVFHHVGIFVANTCSFDSRSLQQRGGGVEGSHMDYG